MPLPSRQAPKHIYTYVVALDEDNVEEPQRRLRSVVPECSYCTREEIFTHFRSAPRGSARVVFALASQPAFSKRVVSVCTQAPQDTLFVLLSPAFEGLFELTESAGLFDWADIEDPSGNLERRLQLIWRNAKRALNLQIEAMENARVRTRLGALLSAQAEIAGLEGSLSEIMQQACERCQELTEGDAAVVELLEGESLVYQATSGTAVPYQGLRIPVAGSLSGLAVLNQQPVLCVDTEQDHRGNREALRRTGTRSLVLAPLVSEQCVLGALKVTAEETQRFDAVDLEVLRLLAEQIVQALRREIDQSARETLLEERADALEKLRATTGQLSAIIKASPLPISGHDLEGRLVLWNPAAERLFGWTAGEVIGHEPPFFAPVDRPDYEDVLRRVQAGETWFGRVPRLTKDGRRRLVDVHMAPYHDREGAIIGAISVVAEPAETAPVAGTQRPSEPADGAVAEPRAGEISAGLVALFENAGVGIALFDRSGRCYRTNRYLLEMLGYNRSELYGQPLHAWVHPLSQTVARGEAERLARGEVGHYALDLQLHTGYGGEVWANLSVTTMHDAQSRPLGSIALVTDMTRYKQAEQQLRLFERAVRASADGIVISDAQAPDNPVIFVNPAFERITGYIASEVIGHNCRFLQGRHRNQARLREIRDALAQGRETQVVLENQRKDGSLFYNEFSLAPVRNGGGDITHFIGIQKDITARQLALEEASRAREKLEARVAERTHALEAAYDQIRHSEQQLRTIAETVPSVLFNWYARRNGETGFYYISPRCEELYGVGAQELMEDWRRLPVHPEDELRLEHSISVAVAEQAPWHFESRLLTPSGRVRWVRARSVPSQVSEEEICFTGVITDITEEHEALLALQASERRFRVLAEATLQGILVVNGHQPFTPLYANHAAAQLFGEKSGQLFCERGEGFISWIAEEERADLPQTLMMLTQGEIDHFHSRLPARRLGGEELVVDVLASSVEWDGHQSIQMSLVDVTEHFEMEQTLRQMALTDELTGLYNRRHFHLLAQQELRRREWAQATVLMLDIDHFKLINDTWGHDGGDAVLEALAQSLSSWMRLGDIVARWGGEEFIALVVDSRPEEARITAERLRQQIEALSVPYGEHALRFTASIGLSGVDADEISIDPAIRRADEALYEAKASGRNQVRVWNGRPFE